MQSVAVFDSGIGGLTFLRQALERLPHEHFIYLADTDNVPYGVRSTAEVRDLVGRSVAFLSGFAPKAIVLACNTATSAAAEGLRARYAFPILGMEPAIKPALAQAAGRRVLLFSTSLTMREGKLRNLMARLDPAGQVEAVAFDELVLAAEAFDFCSARVVGIIRDRLAAYDLAEFGAVVLGCTHFIYYRELIAGLLPDWIGVFDGNTGTLNNLVRTIAACTEGAGGVSFYRSGRPEPSDCQWGRLLQADWLPAGAARISGPARPPEAPSRDDRLQNAGCGMG